VAKKSQKKTKGKKFPANFIERSMKILLNGNGIEFELNAQSSYVEIPTENVWDNVWLKDLKQLSQLLISYLKNHPPDSRCPFFNKKIVSLDIETTDFIPKAREGFVNTIALSILDFREAHFINADGEYKWPEVVMHQSFNMLRKKENVPELLHLAWPHLKDADILLVFNAGFDVSILTTVISNFNLPYHFPPVIIDLMENFRSLDNLEHALERKIQFRRIQTQKGEYSAYYKLFKGKGSKGTEKQIEPLGVYNLMDTLTPLFFYIINQSS
jgi:hypothetical protein